MTEPSPADFSASFPKLFKESAFRLELLEGESRSIARTAAGRARSNVRGCHLAACRSTRSIVITSSSTTYMIR